MKYKKSHGHIHKEVESIYKFIYNHKDIHNVKLMCKVLKVSRSSYYKYLTKVPSHRSIENKQLEEKILDIQRI